ncbi:MAG: prolipoprotein diacylglyceryl transferase [Anaerolineae bacterium]|nr:prolipoprotein diacylglyceryl transferase [Anaerolineae bacterium]
MKIGLWWFHPYTLWVALGSLCALLWLWISAPQYGFKRAYVIRWIWLLTLCALLGGRLSYIVSNMRYFSEHPVAILHFQRTGGLYGVGVWGGGLCATWIWAIVSKRSCRDLFRLLAPAALCVATAAWWGCWEADCAWGQEIWIPHDWVRWLVVESPDFYHIVAPRYAVQILGALWALFLLGIVVDYPQQAYSVLTLYFVGIAGLTWLRADPTLYIGAWRVDFWLNLLLAVSVFLSHFNLRVR